MRVSLKVTCKEDFSITSEREIGTTEEHGEGGERKKEKMSAAPATRLKASCEAEDGGANGVEGFS